MADSVVIDDDTNLKIPTDSESVASDTSFSLNDIDLDDISRRLINSRFLLTALELHTELIERRCELPRLRDFFSNPGNFETQFRLDAPLSIRQTASNLTLDSIDDVSRYSDDNGREGDERVAVLEFELRKAKETIKELRENITELAAGNEAPLQQREAQDDNSVTKEEGILPFEARALNFLTNEYLLKSEYKVTSITFADEVSNQDLDDWDDVGVNTPRPPGLLHLFRDYSKHAIDPSIKGEQEIKELKQDIVNLESTIEGLQSKMAALNHKNDELTTELMNAKRIIDDLSYSPEQTRDDLNTGRASVILENHVNSANKIKNLPQTENGEVESRTQLVDDDVPEIFITSTSNHGSLANVYEDATSEHDSTNYSEGAFVALEDQIEETGYDAQANQDSDTLRSEAETIEKFSSEDHTCPQNDGNDGMAATLELQRTPQEKNDKGVTMPDSPSKRGVLQRFLDALLSQIHTQGDSRLLKEVQMAIDDKESVIHLLARSLPNIAPNVLLNKRDELIPLILCAVRLHPDMKTRDDLLHMLFNLIKRPDEEQRKIIINGFVAFARTAGATRIEAELLPQCWEQIAHKYPERRLLVAETCGFLAPYLPVELQSSLIFSMLRQMLQDDHNIKVREAAVKSLALNLAFTREPGKYVQAYELLAQTLCDKEEEVVNSAKQLLLPVLGVWAADIGKLENHLLTHLMENLKSILENVRVAQSESSGDTAVPALTDLQHQFRTHVECLVNLVTNLFCYVLVSAPFADEEPISVTLNESRIPPLKNKLSSPVLIIGDENRFNFLVDKFDNEMNIEEHDTWESLDWVCNNCISMMCELTGYLSVTRGTFLGQLVCFMCVLCRIFGKPFTNRKVIPYFEKLMRSTVLFFLGETPPLCSALLPIFTCGVLTVFDTDDGFAKLFSFLKQSLLTLATQDLPLHSIIYCIQFICAREKLQAPLVDMLRETLIHPSIPVRRATAVLFEDLVRHVNDNLFSTQVAPAIITLSNDRDVSVRVATLPALATVVEVRSSNSILEKVFLQLQSLFDDPVLIENVQVQKGIIKTFSTIIPNAEPRFREEVLAQRLRKFTEMNSFHEVLNDQKEIADSLVHAYSALLCCHISKETISAHVVPGLRALEHDVKELLPDARDTVSSLLVDAIHKARDDDRLSVGSGSSGSHRGEVKHKFLSGLSKLKDASHRPKDLFKKKE